MKRLTVAIPTFNRNEVLKRHLGALLPQITAECRLLILDNHSDLPVATTLRHEYRHAFENIDIEIRRNETNIGASANLLRCFELCTTEWLWILGDDDMVNAAGVSMIIRAIERLPNAVLLNFCGPGLQRSHPVVTQGVTEFIGAWDSFSNLLFISVNIYRNALLKPHIRYGYFFGYTCAPHLAVLLQALRPSGEACLLTEQIIDGQRLIDPLDSWAAVIVYMGRMLLLELPLSQGERRLLHRKLLQSPRLEDIVTYFIKVARKTGDINTALFLYDHGIYRATYFQRFGIMRIKAMCYRWMIRCPKMGEWILTRYYQYRRVRFGLGNRPSLDAVVAVDRFRGV